MYGLIIEGANLGNILIFMINFVVWLRKIRLLNLGCLNGCFVVIISGVIFVKIVLIFAQYYKIIFYEYKI